MAVRSDNYLPWGENTDVTRIPEGWEVRVAEDDRVFFLDHSNKRTQWDHPLTKSRYKVSHGLPYGWQKFKDEEGNVVYMDHLEQMVSLLDPRLLTDVAYDFPNHVGMKRYPCVRNHFRTLVKASYVLKDVDLSHKVAVVTGANSGLGFQTALELALCGAHVILACRDPVRGDLAARRILDRKPTAKVEVMQLDLSSLANIRSFAEAYTLKGLPLHILVLNAGVYGGPFTLTSDGVERHFGVNHLGHFYLTKLLFEVLRNSRPVRIVVVSSESHWYPSVDSTELPLHTLQHPSAVTYSPTTAYGTSKLCNILFTLELHRRFSDKGIFINAVHPGNLLATNLMRDCSCFYKAGFVAAKFFTKSLEQACSTIVYCAAHPSMENIGGLYMYECWPTEPSNEAQDPSTGAALWELSERIIAEKTAVSC